MARNVYFNFKNYYFDNEINGKQFSEKYLNNNVYNINLNQMQHDIYMFNQIYACNKVYFISFFIIPKDDISDDTLLKNITHTIYKEQLNVVEIKKYINNLYFAFGNIDNNISIYNLDVNDKRTYNEIIEDLYENVLKDLSKSNTFFKIIIINKNDNKKEILCAFSHIIFAGNSIFQFSNEVINNKQSFIEINDNYISTPKNVIKQICEKIYQGKYFPIVFKNGNTSSNDFSLLSKVLDFDSITFKQLKQNLKSKRLDIFSFFSSIYGILLCRFTGESNFLIGFPVENKSNTILTSRLNILIMPYDIKNYNVYENARKIQINKINLLLLKDVPTNEILEYLSNNCNTEERLNINIAMSYQKILDSDYFYVTPLIEKESEYDIAMEIIEYEEKVSVIIKNKNSFMPSYVFDNFRNYFSSIVINAIIGKETDYLTTIQKNKKCNETFNNKDFYIHDIFNGIVKGNPNQVAVKFNEKEITYIELDCLSNQIGNMLIQEGVRIDQIVITCLPYSIFQVVIMLAIWKIGAVYLPLDYNCPDKRIDDILDFVRPSVFISDKNCDKVVKYLNVNEMGQNGKYFSDILTFRYSKRAYIIFTSGTSGIPKGVVNTHNGVCNLIINAIGKYEITSRDIGITLHSLAFDFSLWELLVSLLSGGKIVLINNEKISDIGSYYDIITKENVSLLNLTPSVFTQLNSIIDKKYHYKENNVRILFLGAECLHFNMLENWMNMYKNCKIVNLYGPSETSIIATSYQIDKEILNQEKSNRYSCIGYPINSADIFILNKRNELALPGCTGEICIAGDCVGLGYLNDSLLTLKHFILLPDGRTLYKTDDIGFIDNKNRVYYIGRNGSYVKIKGFRVDLKEILFAIKNTEAIEDAAVLVINDRIIAFIVTSCIPDKVVNILREELSKQLPYYMLPGNIQVLEVLPKTVSGKIDSSSLEKLYWESINSTSVYNVKNETEKRVIEAVKKTLSLESVNITDDFFYLGGDSINVISFISDLGMDIPIETVYKYPVFLDFCKYIEGKKTHEKEYLTMKSDSFQINEYDKEKYEEALKLSCIFSLEFNNAEIIFNGKVIRSGSNENRINFTVLEEGKIKRAELYICTKTIGISEYVQVLKGCYDHGICYFLEKEINSIVLAPSIIKKLPVPVNAIYPLNSMQKSMLYDSVLSYDKEMYSCIVAYCFESTNFSLELFKKTIDILIYENDILRTSYIDIFRCQAVSENCNLEFINQDIRNHTFEERISFYEEEQERLKITKEDIKKGVMFRFKLYQYENTAYQVALFFNHSIIDGYSISNLISQLNEYYYRLISGNEIIGKRRMASIGNVILEEKKLLASDDYVEFWRNEILTSTYISFVDNKEKCVEDKLVFSIIDSDIADEIAGKYHTTTSILYYSILLYVINDNSKTDAAIGIIQNNRDLCYGEDLYLAGNFLNTVVLKISYSEISFDAYLEKVKDKYMDLQKYKAMPLIEIQNMCNSLGRTEKLYDICLNYTDFTIQYGGNNVIKMLPSQIKPKGKIKTNINLNITKYSERSEFTYEINIGDESKVYAVEIFNNFIDLVQKIFDDYKGYNSGK